MKKKSTLNKNKKEKSPLFLLLDEISFNQKVDYFDSLTPVEQKEYKSSKYMIHRFLSMNPHYLPIVNLIQRYNVPDRAHYLFLINVIPRQKQFFKYIKGASAEKYPSWLVDIVVEHYKISKSEAIEYINILTLTDLEELRTLCTMYGIEPTKLDKALK